MRSEALAAHLAHVDRCPECQAKVEVHRANERLLAAAREAEAETEAFGAVRTDGAAPHLFPGYQIIKELSRGGQGVVYQALQESTKRKVAIKVLLEGPFASRSARQRFEREIELVAQLKHPNIVPIFHSGQSTAGQPFYVMDYVRGLPLHRHVRDMHLPLEDTLRLFARICEAVEYAHQKGLIHRDLKPANILVDGEGQPRILDFGLAKLLGAPVETLVSVSRSIVGTLPYMSPEQVRGNPDEIDTRTDIYALGVILYELLTGQYPYPVIGQMADVLRHIAETPPTPPSRCWTSTSGVALRSSRRLRPGACPIDDEVQTIVLKTLAKERERRYQSAGELARDVQRYLAGEPIDAKRDSALYLLRKLATRSLPATAIVVLLFISILGSVLVSLFFYRGARHAERHAEQLAATAMEDKRQAQIAEGAARLTARQAALGLFLLEWHAGETERAREVRQSVDAGTSERAVMDFLLDDTVEVLPESPALRNFAAAERQAKAGQTADALAAFDRALGADLDRGWQALVRARRDAVRHAASH